MLNNFDPAQTDRISVSELTSSDLGRMAVVTHKENTVMGALQACTFSEYHVRPKHGPTFNVALTLGKFDLYTDQKTEIWLAKE